MYLSVNKGGPEAQALNALRYRPERFLRSDAGARIAVFGLHF
jgi:hypothetical protein